APVGEIVPTLLAGAGMVRDFVARQSSGAGQRLRRVEKIGGGVAVRNDERALCRQRPKPRARLDRELVEREVTRPEGERFTELGLPSSGRLARACINE